MLKCDRKKMVKDFVDVFMKQYLHLRSSGFTCQDAIMEIYSRCHDVSDKEWKDLSLMDQILRWHGLSSSTQIRWLKKSDKEEDNIVRGIEGTLPIACHLRSMELDDYIACAVEYLKEKYNIGSDQRAKKKH